MIASLAAYSRLDFRLIFRERFALVMILLFPALMYAFFGFMFRNATYGELGASYYDEYTPSFTALILLNVALMNIGPVLVIFKELGFFRRLRVTPLPTATIWLATVLRASVVFLIGYAGIVGIGASVFGHVPNIVLVEFVPALVVSMFAMFSFGFLLGAVFQTSSAAFTGSMIIFQPMLLLSGASFPKEMFPSWLQAATELLPMTHVVSVLRLAWIEQFFSLEGLVRTCVLLAFGGACALWAARSFRWSAS